MSQDNAADDDFQKELLGLFAVEDYEWLGQILASLVRLEEVAEPSTATDAIDGIVRGLTSLGGSAATVDLPGIQESVFGLLPLAEQLRSAETAAPSELLLKIRETLRQITASVAESTGTPATVSFDAPKADLRRAKDFLAALQELRRGQSREGIGQRHIVNAVMKRVQKDLDRGVSQVDGQAIRQFFDDMSRADEDYLGRIQLAIPAIATAVSALKMTALQPAAVSSAQWKSLLETLDQLVELSRQRYAHAIMHFFQGLSTFVRIVADRRMTISAQRFELVEARVQGVMESVKQWGIAGQTERNAIVHLVPE